MVSCNWLDFGACYNRWTGICAMCNPKTSKIFKGNCYDPLSTECCCNQWLHFILGFKRCVHEAALLLSYMVFHCYSCSYSYILMSTWSYCRWKCFHFRPAGDSSILIWHKNMSYQQKWLWDYPTAPKFCAQLGERVSTIPDGFGTSSQQGNTHHWCIFGQQAALNWQLAICVQECEARSSSHHSAA